MSPPANPPFGDAASTGSLEPDPLELALHANDPPHGWRRWWPYLLIGAATLLVWGQTLSFDFVWDDRQFIQELSSIRSLRNAPAMFTSLAAQSSLPEGFTLFRPLRTLQYAVLYLLGGKPAPQPWLFHLANVLWHGGAAMLLYTVGLGLFGRGPCRAGPLRTQVVALLTALAFAVHPVVSEVVCWAKSLDDIMATVFTLAATRALLRWRGDRRGYLAALGWFLLAVYSKESAVPFVAVAFVIFHKLQRVSWQRSSRLTLGFAAAALVFLVHRHWVIGRTSQTAPISGSYGQTLWDTLAAGPEYLRLLGGMPPFRIDYSFMHGHLPGSAWVAWAGLALLGLLLGLTVWTWRRPASGVAGFGLAWFGLFLLPVANLVPMMQYMAERFLYLPLIGLLIALGALLCHLPRLRLSATVYALVVLTWAGLASARSWIWKDELTLFVQSSLQRPRTPRVEQNAVAAIFNLPQVRAVFERDPAGRKLRTVGPGLPARPEAVFNTLAEAHRLFPDDEDVATALAILEAKAGRFDRAIPLFEAVTRQAPANAIYWADLGQACLDAHRFGQAQAALDRALALDAENVQAWRTESSLCWQRRDYRAALRAFEKLRRLEPGNRDYEYWIRRVQEQLSSNPAPPSRPPR
ncbi:MAG: tetratricopeptide repeat protein [Verrucomicrobia bacterium]|nr:tetratricopeptide repeat protein [Verrucomicrobiota bacterium]